MLVITENIEMELFSEETCMVIQTQEEEEKYPSEQRFGEHPLAFDEDEPLPQVQTQPRKQAKPKSESPAEGEAKHCPPVPGIMEEVEIEMEVFPPLRKPTVEPSVNKVARIKWKKLAPEKMGLVVKDVVCLPGGHSLAQLERHTAIGMTARITIDRNWSASQMQSRLAMLFWGQFVKGAGQRFSFTYLQCVQGSRALFIPDTPSEGWTGEQVLRISEHSALYIFSHQNYQQADNERSASETPVVNGDEICLEATTASCPVENEHLGRQTKRHVGGTTIEVKLELDNILSLFRQKNFVGDVESHIQVSRSDLLHCALKAATRLGFSFRTKPIISFSGEETDGHEGPLREFFRLALLELQDSSVFEGHPGRLLFTYDLGAFEDRKYYQAGVLIGWSLAQGGPGPRCLHPALYQLMCGQNPSLEDFDCRDIVDAEAQIRLQQLHSCADVMLLYPSLSDWLSSCGIPGIYLSHSDEIPAIYSRLVKHFIYHRVASMISQFKEGMNSCGGLWDMVQSHWEMFVPVMTGAQQHPLSLEEFKQLFTVCYSHTDGRLRAAEEATVGHWETVLSLVRDGQADFSFEDLLTFITGADHLPPLGFSKRISLRFYAQDASVSCVPLPYTSTCALELFLPRGAAATADLLALLSRAVLEAEGFVHLQKERDEENHCMQVQTGL